MAGDAEDKGGRRRDGDVQSGEWGELDDGGKYWLRGAGTGDADRLGNSCRKRVNPWRTRRQSRCSTFFRI